MPVITITTDFGMRDHYVGSLKGDVLSACRQVQIVDVAHDVPPFHVHAAAFVVKNSYPHFPKGAIHVILVNAHDRKSTRLIAVRQNGHFFIAPDNGLLPLALKDYPHQAVAIGAEGNSTTAHSKRKLAASAAGHLAKGQSLEALGPRVNDLVELKFPSPTVDNGQIRGNVLYIDGYENIIVDITKSLFEEVGRGRRFNILFHNEAISEVHNAYCDTVKGEIVCLFNSAGYLTIALNKGKARSLLGIDYHTPVRVEFEAGS